MASRAGASWTHSFDLQQGGYLGGLLSPPLANVAEAVARYDELLRLFDSAPRCPEKALGPFETTRGGCSSA